MKKRISFLLMLVIVFTMLNGVICVNAATGNDLVTEARKYIDVPYVSGGRTPSGFDCCGLVYYVCKQFGINIGNGNQTDQINYGTVIDHYSLKNGDTSNAQPGDLIYFDYYFDGSIDHVAIYSGNGNAIHALSQGVKETPLSWYTGMGNSTFYGTICGLRRVASNDTEIPSITNPYLEITGSNTFTVNCTLNDNVGVTRVWLNIYGPGGHNGYALNAQNGKFSHAIKTDDYGGLGKYTVDIYAFDAAGNEVGSGASGNICAPTECMLSADKSTIKAGETVSFTYKTAGASQKALKIYLDGELFDTVSLTDDEGTVNYSFVKEGAYTCNIEAVNLMGTTNSENLNITVECENKDLPIEIQINKIEFFENEEGYNISGELINHLGEPVTGTAVVTLKTQQEKMLLSSNVDFRIAANATKSFEYYVPYTKKASVAEIFAVKSKNGSIDMPISKPTKKQIESNADWSEWSDSLPDNTSGLIIESKEQYRTSTYETTASETANMDGWTVYDTKTSYGTWGAVQSSQSKPAASDTLQLVGYNWQHWCNYYSGAWNIDSIAYGSSCVQHTASTTSMLPTYNMADMGGQQAYGGFGSGASACGYNYYVWFFNGYRYQTRTKTTTYYYNRWSDWGEWTDGDVPAETGELKVETKTVYRFKAANNMGEDNQGTEQRVLGTAEEGKQITLTVYNASNKLEYIGQTTASEAGIYQFIFKTNENAANNLNAFISVEGKLGRQSIKLLNENAPVITGFAADTTSGLINISTENIPTDAVIYLAAYSDKGKLLKLQELTLNENTAQTTLLLTDVKKLKAFIWKNRLNLLPICNCAAYEIKY